MKKSDDTPSSKVMPYDQPVMCHMCGMPMRKISWKITAGAHDAGKEVEHTTLECAEDKNFVTFEVSTGNLSEFASPSTRLGF